MGLLDFLKGKDGKDGKDAKPCKPCKDGIIGGLGFKTILDYGAILYLSKEEAIKGKSCHKAIQDMLDETGSAIFPPYGWFKNEGTTLMFRKRDSVTSLGQGNKGVNLVSTKPINMFLPIHNRQEVSGFTAWYVGDKINKECAVVRIGGDKRNIGSIDTGQWGVPNNVEYHHWARRTRMISPVFDFDFVGDEDVVISYSRWREPHYRTNFKPNATAHAIWVDYSEKDEDKYSHFHRAKIRGTWKHVNNGLKITHKNGSNQSLNGLDMVVRIWGARQFFNISIGDLGVIWIKGQTLPMLDYNKDDPLYKNSNKEDFEEFQVPAFYIKGSNTKCDVFIYDRHGSEPSENNHGNHKLTGIYEVDKLDLQGQNTILHNIKYIDADISGSTLVNHSQEVEN